MHDRTCALCAEPFIARSSRHRFCSKTCRRRHEVSSGAAAESRRRYLSKPENRRRHSVVCVLCGTEAMVTSPKVKFCSHDCSVLWRLENPLLDTARWKGRPISTSVALVCLGSLVEFPDPHEIVEIRCRYCEQTFTAERWHQKLYCRERCRELFHKWGRSRQFDDGRTWQFLVSGSCSWCAATFVSKAVTGCPSPRFCSDRCVDQAGKARRGRFVVPPSVRQQIYARDGFVCQLCKGPVDMALGPSEQWGATLDHVVPQSHQLVPDHSPANLRLAHRYCNSIRGDLSFIDDSFFEEAS